MKKSDLTNALVQIHNLIAEVTVKGDDTIRVANAIKAMRSLIQTVTQEGVITEGNDGGDAM